LYWGIGEKKNRLLWITLVLSILAHGLIITQMTGIFHQTSFIELSLKQDFKPSVTNIPQPPKPDKPDHNKARAKIIEPQIKKITDIPTVLPVPAPLLKPREFVPVAKKILVPPVHFPKPVKTSSGKTTRKFGSAKDYFQMVRMKIESRKKYPPSARRQNLTGRVTVKFVIRQDGSVSNLKILKKSKFKSLNQAALKAIKSCVPFPGPPRAYFKGAVSVQLSIVFDLN
jgi:periplasmic protein TonB